VEGDGGNKFKVNGDLTIHGITRQVTFDVEYSGPEKSPYGETSMGFTATAMVNREDYGLLWNVALESGGVMIGKDVRILIDIEADLSDG
jgi:polyisoprenoid-binding protein YceI